ncbi:MAG: alpha/beta fold hydrolase [Crocinitomicaceae bacterium]|nr:alpha/beta fold hydrolase [Crocinitomicaceae bacterium]
MKLHHRILGEGTPLYILHGLFGYSDNWQTLGRKFAEDYQVVFVDQRNHGHSPHDDEFNYQAMAADLLELMNDLGHEKIYLLGHSMGGKTSMEFVKNNAHRIEKLIVADIGLKGYQSHHDVIIEGLESIDLNVIKSRGAADKQLANYVENIGVRQFLLKNLYWVEKGQLGWRMNIPAIVKNMENILGAIDLESCDVPTLFIRGELSNYILEEDYDSLEEVFSDVEIETVNNAGHWVHAEAPREFYSLVRGFL